MFLIVHAIAFALLPHGSWCLKMHSGDYLLNERFIQHKSISWREMSNRESYTCTQDEDRQFSRERFGQVPTESPAPSFGFLYYVFGESNEKELATSMGCLQAAYGKDINITVFRPDEHELNCTMPTMKERKGKDWNDLPCWNQLMQLKVEAARSSPYDVTLMIDTDVVANPTLGEKAQVIPTLTRLFTRDLWDIAFAESLESAKTDLKTSSANGGWVAYKKSAATDRFFGCVLKMMREHNYHEQAAYMHLTSLNDLEQQAMLSTRITRLPQNWQCRSQSKTPFGSFESNLHYQQNYSCIFTHSHVQTALTSIANQVRETCNVQ